MTILLKYGRLQIACLVQPLELVVLANLCRRIIPTKATHNGKLLAFDDLIEATDGAIDALELESLLMSARCCKEKLLGGYIVRFNGKYCFQFSTNEVNRVRKVVKGFVQPQGLM